MVKYTHTAEDFFSYLDEANGILPTVTKKVMVMDKEESKQILSNSNRVEDIRAELIKRQMDYLKRAREEREKENAV